ncbi:HD-GYP domain-containing protein [Phosphitispora sp. TUW77]|uniref:HD-GYP domain-containing protein n=1 Tax=Phosphitispora sp. TUW77 TaxID=3152361 RepID=UPI003AB7CE7B
MKQLIPSNLEPGMVLADTVFAANGRVLLAEGTKLTQDLIERLQEMQIMTVFVNDENTISIDPDDVLINRVHSDALQVLGHFLPADIFGERLGSVKERYDLLTDILSAVIKDNKIANLYLDLRTIDDDTLDHSIAVCVLSLIMGDVLKMDKERLLLLGKAAMAHDIGKKFVPRELIAKKEDRTPEEAKLYEDHTKHGYRFLREMEFDVSIARVALYHHERWDGSGYINKIAGEEIDLFSRIVAVADVYDDVTKGISLKQKYLPHEAMEFLYGAGNIYFDARVVKAFTGSIYAYPLGSIVKLSTGEIGIVVNVQKTMAPRPIIKVFYDKENNRLDYPRQVDLSEEKTLFITKIL